MSYPSDSPIRIAVLSPGSHAHEYLIPCLEMSRLANIVALTSRNPDRRAQLARQFPGADVADDWRSVIERDDVDAVLVASTPDVHGEVARAALALGTPVFLEKPPALSVRDAKALAALEQETRTPAFVGFNFRFCWALAKLAEWSRDWTLESLRVRFVSSKPTQPMWGLDSVASSSLFAVGVHAIDLALHLFDDVPTRTSVVVPHRGSATMSVGLEFGGAGAAVLELGNHCNRFEFDVEAVYSGGIVVRIRGMRHIEIMGAEAPTFDRKESTVLEASPLLPGFMLGGYEQAVASFIQSCRGASLSASPLSRFVPTAATIEEIARLGA